MKNLNKRKTLAAKTLRVGENKIIFDTLRLDEIKEAITKQDIRDLYEAGAIMIKENKGRKINVKRTTKRGIGKVKFRIGNKKAKYIIIVRKLRNYLNEIRKEGKIDMDKYYGLRRMIRAGAFKDKSHLKDYMGGKKL